MIELADEDKVQAVHDLNLIEIEWIADYFDCETCGGAYADGAVVRMNGEVILELLPEASCYGGTSYEQEDVFKAIFKHLGYEVKDYHE
jgi:hypothetical protein